MTTGTIRAQLADALTHIAPLYDPATTVALDEVLDSMGLTELLAYIETEWAIDIDGADLTRANFGTLDAVHQLVQRKLGGRA